MPVKDCAGIKSPEPFGIKNYNVPFNGLQPRNSALYKLYSNQKYVNQYDKFAAEKKWVPGPQTPHCSWGKLLEKTPGKMGVYKKITFTESVFLSEKDKVPPTRYETFNAKR